jgi:hypothetical protein
VRVLTSRSPPAKARKRGVSLAHHLRTGRCAPFLAPRRKLLLNCMLCHFSHRAPPAHRPRTDRAPAVPLHDAAGSTPLPPVRPARTPYDRNGRCDPHARRYQDTPLDPFYLHFQKITQKMIINKIKKISLIQHKATLSHRNALRRFQYLCSHRSIVLVPLTPPRPLARFARGGSGREAHRRGASPRPPGVEASQRRGAGWQPRPERVATPAVGIAASNRSASCLPARSASRGRFHLERLNQISTFILN